MNTMDLPVVYLMMLLVFLRHMSVYKDPNKISYTTIVMALGAFGFILHFILYAYDGYEMSALKESLWVLGTGIILSAIMSVMRQSVFLGYHEAQRGNISVLGDDLESVKTSLNVFSAQIEQIANMENTTQEQLRAIFKEEIDALNVIQANQKLFVSKIEALLSKQQIAMEKFEDFTLTELPGLDNVVHRHIDLLRISEQDHFNQLKKASKVACDEQKHLNMQLEEIRHDLHDIITHPVPEKSIALLDRELERILGDFARQLHTISSKSESMVTTLLENDALLRGSREQSELIMQQMVLSSKQMREITSQSRDLADSIKPLGKLFVSAEALNKEFSETGSALNDIISSLQAVREEKAEPLSDHIGQVLDALQSKIDALSEMMESFRNESTPADARSVQELASKVRLHKSYLGDNQE